MEYLRRKIDDFLLNWKHRTHMPLIVTGARQVGKTASIIRFAKANYKSVVHINFALDTRFRRITSQGYSVESIIKEMSLIDGRLRFIPNDTLIFFDEIQDFPDIATSLKSFREDGKYDVIASGSLLGVQYKKIASFAVGNQETYELSSFDFEEFLWAAGRKDDFIEAIYAPMLSGVPYSDTELSVFNDLFITYCIVGGMPAVVSRYMSQQNFQGVAALQREIITSYIADARKYCEGLDQTRIIEVYKSIPAQLAKENKKFQFSHIRKGARARDFDGCVQWLEDAGIIRRCYCLNSLELPLQGNYQADVYKLYYPDTGLLLASLDEESAEDFRLNRNIHTYKGGLLENIISEAIYKAGKHLYYYKRENSTLELDFVLRTTNSLVPIEVKASNNQAKSLKTTVKSDSYEDVCFGIKLTNGNIGYSDNIYTFPHFCAFLLPRLLADRSWKIDA